MLLPVVPQLAVHVLQDPHVDTVQLTAVHLDQAFDLLTNNSNGTKRSNAVARIVLGFMEYISAETSPFFMIPPSAKSSL